MSKATAKNLAHAEYCRIAALNLGRKDLPAEDVGSAVLGILGSVAAIERVKDRAGARDQSEVMELIDSEVDAATWNPFGEILQPCNPNKVCVPYCTITLSMR